MCGGSGSGGGAPGVGAGIKKAQGWGWGSDEGGAPIAVKPPEDASGVPAIVFSLSATITRDRIERVLGEAVSIWEITIKGGIRASMELSVTRSPCHIMLSAYPHPRLDRRQIPQR